VTHFQSRRRLLKTAGFSLPTVFFPVVTMSAAAQPRRLSFYHTHTSEKIDVVYSEGHSYLPDALDEINYFLRDFRSGESHPIDTALLDFLHDVQARTGSQARFEIISGYRSPATNAMLRNKSRGVAKRSMHMQGRAVDVRLRDVDSNQLRKAARNIGGGGVGYYAKSDFVHLDTGRVRFW
jgi:uncharacterized protein YcbK (DUF882 family)